MDCKAHRFFIFSTNHLYVPQVLQTILLPSLFAPHSLHFHEDIDETIEFSLLRKYNILSRDSEISPIDAIVKEIIRVKRTLNPPFFDDDMFRNLEQEIY